MLIPSKHRKNSLQQNGFVDHPRLQGGSVRVSPHPVRLRSVHRTKRAFLAAVRCGLGIELGQVGLEARQAAHPSPPGRWMGSVSALYAYKGVGSILLPVTVDDDG